MEAIEKLKVKRKVTRTSCTRLITNIDSFLQSVNKDNIDDQAKLLEYLTNLQEKQNDLKILNEKIEELITDKTLFETEIQKSSEYDESICDSKFKIKIKLNEFKTENNQPSDSIQSASVSNMANILPISINLPKLNIPTFSGDPSNFLEFFNSFTSAIDLNDSLRAVDKFMYLKSFLSGEALRIVSAFALNEENYRSCLQLLKNRYGKEDQLISCFVNKLLEIEPVKNSSNIKGLRSLYDESEISIRNLQSMGVASDNFGHLLIPILLKLLPHNLVVEFHRKRDPSKIGDVNELMKFIKFEIESREAANAVSSLSLKTQETDKSKGEFPRNRFKIKSNIPTAAALSTVAKKPCIFCNTTNAHTPLQCKKLSPEQKRYKLKKEGRCYRCFYKHLQINCKVKIQPCNICESSQHNELFHGKIENNSVTSNQTLEGNGNSKTVENEAVMSSVTKNKIPKNTTTTLLQTACVKVESESRKLLARILYDSASSKTFIRKDLAKALNSQILRKEKLCVYTFADRNPKETEFECIKITLRNRKIPFQFINVEALITDEICGTQLYSNINYEFIQNMFSDNYEFADSFQTNHPIQLLLGADVMYQTIIGRPQKINKQLFIQPTIFGKTLVGQVRDNQIQNSAACLNVYCSSKENDLTHLWQMESFLSDTGSETSSNNLSNFEGNLRFVENRYESPLLWKCEEMKENLHNNLENARQRFSLLEKRFNRDESLFERYNEVMQEQLREGIIEMCTAECFIGYVMPHHEVYRENSTSTKTRIVYDASSKQKNNYSLNEALIAGENLNANLIDVILKFREHKIAFCGDIARAFLQIQVAECDRNYLCFFYFKDCNKSQPVTLYHFNRHCFGVTCSPHVLAATIKTHIKLYEKTHPLAYDMLNKSLYVDDLFYGSPTVEEAFKLSADAVSIFKGANMTLRKFDSNSQELKNLWKNANPLIEVNECSDRHLKVLGLNWNNIEDTIGLNVTSLLENLDENTRTKRNVLHTAAKIFDPSGLISPFLIRIKIILQELWQLGLEWDEEFSELTQEWLTWCKEVRELQNLNIPRYYFPNSVSVENIQLHVFSDASLKSFGAVAYFRYKTSPDTFNTSFIISKARVAPLKKLTLPRLELMGAVIAARIVNYLKTIFKPIESIFLWSDSTIVLHWIKGSPSKWKQFVSNRVTEIQELTEPHTWKHCIGKQNPADLLTRGMTTKELINSQKWWHGPEWLIQPENSWPKANQVKYDPTDKEIQSEYKSSVIVNSVIVHENFIKIERFNSLKKLLRVTAWVLRFVCILTGKGHGKGPLNSEELKNAENLWVKIVQNENFSNEIQCLQTRRPLPKNSKLLSLNPFLDDEKLLRVAGRLQKANFSTDEKHPIILPSKSKFTELLVWNSHELVIHSGVAHTLVQLREQYWILRARQTIKTLLRKCVICKRFNSSPGDQLIAPLPTDRVEPALPYSHVGVDFGGPLFVKDSDAKQYILLITCAVTRCLHIELVGDLSTDTFLLAFRRFVARRGLPAVVISDNARTFKRAELELKQLWTIINHPDVQNFFASHGVKWKYIVERAAWWGGFYERMVRCVKVALRKVLGKSSLSVMQLQTILIEIEAMINSRPITYVGTDIDEPSALTPAHFLLGKRITSLPPVRLHLDNNISSRKILIRAFNYREKLMRSFWSRWKNEYLLNLRSAHSSLVKTNIPQFKVNDIVLIKDDHLPRNFWKLGRILELFPGRDGKVRACKLKTESAIIKRPVQLLYNLELQN